MKRVLILSPLFPPVNAPDLQRVRMSLPYYRANGWDVTVLAVDERRVDRVKEPQLLATVPSYVRVETTGAISQRFARLLGVRNVGLRAIAHLFLRGSQVLSRDHYDLVFISTTQFAVFPLGRLWKILHGVPFVLDFQDPWRTDFYEQDGARRPPGGWKYQVARLMAWGLEGWSVRSADGLMSVSPVYLTALLARYGDKASIPTAVVRIGASEADIEAAAGLEAAEVDLPAAADTINILYTGASGPAMPHALAVLFGALRRYRMGSPKRASKLRFHFVGTSYASRTEAAPTVLPFARDFGVEDQVSEVPYQIGHLECMRLHRQADVLLIAGSSDPAYSPSKIYTYCLADRPMLSLAAEGSVFARLVEELGCSTLIRFSVLGNNASAHASLADAFDQMVDGAFRDKSSTTADRSRHSAYLSDSLTRRQCDLFNAVCLG